MPLSKPKPRQHLHTREIRCDAYKRDDGLWDIEGIITDTKSYSFSNYERDGIAAGEPLHQMRVRIAIDDDMIVREAEAVTEYSPFKMCGDIGPDYANLVGIKVGPGWRKNVIARMGGVKGCTHISDLVLGPIAVTAFQAVIPNREKRQTEPADGSRPVTLDTCHALAESSPVVEWRWPNFYKPKDGAEASDA